MKPVLSFQYCEFKFYLKPTSDAICSHDIEARDCGALTALTIQRFNSRDVTIHLSRLTFCQNGPALCIEKPFMVTCICAYSDLIRCLNPIVTLIRRITPAATSLIATGPAASS